MCLSGPAGELSEYLATVRVTGHRVRHGEAEVPVRCRAGSETAIPGSLSVPPRRRAEVINIRGAERATRWWGPFCSTRQIRRELAN